MTFHCRYISLNLATNIQRSKVTADREHSVSQNTRNSSPTASVTKVWDVVIGVTPVSLGGVVSDSQMVKSRQENQQPYYDDGNGAVRVL